MTKLNYQTYYKEFSQNVAHVVRTWHSYVYLMNSAPEGSDLLFALNKAPRFWMDYKYTAVQTTIIVLGKIFDISDTTFSIYGLRQLLHPEISHFSKEKIRARKIEIGGDFEGLDEYIENMKELTEEGIRAIAKEIKRAAKIWEKLKPLRDKIYAHSVILTGEERTALYDAVLTQDVIDIIQILINISHALWQAEYNGMEPNFSSNHTAPLKYAEKDTEDLIASLLPNRKRPEVKNDSAEEWWDDLFKD